MKPNKATGYIQKTKIGILDHSGSMHLAQELALAVDYRKDRNVLIDLQQTTINADIHSLIETAAECGRLMCDFPRKIAVVIPQCKDEQNRAKRFKACMIMQNFRYENFHDRKDAIRWLTTS